jgi:hypothetical protein
MFKHAKWISWFLYRDHGIQMPADQLMWKNDPSLSKKGYALVRSYDDEISELLEHVHIYDGKVPIDTIERAIDSRARALGTYYYTDNLGVYKDDCPIPFKSFEDDGKIETTKVGDRDYIEVQHKKEKFKLYKEDRRYFLHNSKTFVFIYLDGIGLLGGTNFQDKKSALDRVSILLAEARDKYGFSPIVISQINRSLSSVQRLKMHGNDMAPQLDDIQGSSQMAHDADLVLALFDPHQYKAYDNNGYYGGYDIHGRMLHPKGFSRFRSFHVLKNSFGMAGNVFGLKYLGESNNFETLPLPDDDKINEIYADIALGK